MIHEDKFNVNRSIGGEKLIWHGRSLLESYLKYMKTVEFNRIIFRGRNYMDNNLSTKKTMNYQDLNLSRLLKFIIPSVIGMILFIVPLKINGSVTLLIAVICQGFQDMLGVWNLRIVTGFVFFSAFGTLFVSTIKPKFLDGDGFIRNTLRTGWVNLTSRLIAVVLLVMLIFEIGPGPVLDPGVGPVMLEMAYIVGIWLIPACILLPLMTEYGLMEFIGTLLNKLTRPLFNLPGRATIDMITSWVCFCELGLVLTNEQYKQGYYTGREASVIATCFTASSIAFWLVIGQTLDIGEYFLQFYAVIIIAGFMSAGIMSRIPPLSKKSNSYFNGSEERKDENPENLSQFKQSVLAAANRAESAPKIKDLLVGSIKLVVELFISLVPIILTIGIIGTILATYTPIFDWLSLPFKYYLELLGVPEAAAAAPATVYTCSYINFYCFC